jgi:hypothetical protein
MVQMLAISLDDLELALLCHNSLVYVRAQKTFTFGEHSLCVKGAFCSGS